MVDTVDGRVFADAGLHSPGIRSFGNSSDL